MKVGVVFVTHNARHHLPYCLPPVLNSPLKPRVLVMNSSSGDGTVELAMEMGAETLTIPRAKFNHGKSRELARKQLGTDIIVMMTPDAYAVSNTMLDFLVKPLIEGKAAVSYARQIPHKGAPYFECFPRSFNYPLESHVRRFDDRKEWGVYTIFCSNSCAAYLSSALDEVGGFDDVLVGEDTVAVSSLLRNGHSVAYVAEAVVHHSHSYTLGEEFARSFDTGLARKSYAHLVDDLGRDKKRGLKYLKNLLAELRRREPAAIPYAIVQTGLKYVGYRLGRLSFRAPIWWKKIFSGQDFYWKIQ